MAATLKLISSTTLTSTGNVIFNPIPQIYTDLFLILNIRTNIGSYIDDVYLTFNGSGTESSTSLHRLATNSLASTTAAGLILRGVASGSSATASTYGTAELYIPRYSNTSYTKQFFAWGGGETNDSSLTQTSMNGYTRDSTTAITSITITCNGTPVAGSYFALYGISNT
jgi:hypothetical protein